MTGLVRTILGDVPSGDLGTTYMHEHVIIRSRLVAETMPHISLPSVGDAVAELALCRNAGVNTIVDAMPAGSGRDIHRLAEVSRRSGIHIVATTGLHTAKYYGTVAWESTDSVDQLAERFIADVQDGIDRHDHLSGEVDRSGHRAGIIKVATAHMPDEARDGRVFEAAAIAAAATGAPILTHCEAGLGAPNQIEALLALDVPLERVVISHTDKITDLGYHRDLLASGVNLEYDQALRQSESDGGVTAHLLANMIEEGFLSQLMLGTDGARRTLWQSLGGGPGLAWLASGFRLTMAASGIGESEQTELFVANPARFLQMDSGET